MAHTVFLRGLSPLHLPVPLVLCIFGKSLPQWNCFLGLHAVSAQPEMPPNPPNVPYRCHSNPDSGFVVRRKPPQFVLDANDPAFSKYFFSMWCPERCCRQ